MKSIVEKPWGSYQVLEEGTNYTVKNIIVNPGGEFSLQSHKHRSEHWTIVQGIAEVRIDNKTLELESNDSIHIPKNSGKFIRDQIKNDLDTTIIKEFWNLRNNFDKAHIPFM